MNEIELLHYQIKSLEKNLLGICKNINNRLNIIENDVDELREQLDTDRYR